MKKLVLIAGIMLLLTSGIFAQSMAIENVYRPYRTDFGAIREGSDVKGYYVFYASDKIDKKTYEWSLQVYDNNLKSLKQIKFQASKDVDILESSFNGSDLIFLF
jgi:hypothetical protein